MVGLVALFQTTQDRDGRRLIGLVHHHRLESALQGFVALEVFLILVQRGGTYRAEIAPRQRRLQDVRCVHRAAGLACAYEGVNLINEEDDFAGGLRYLVDDTFQTLLKLALVLRTGDKSTHVKRVNLLVFQVLGHIAADDSVCQTLHNSGLSHTGLTDKDRVVLGAPAQDLQHPTNLVVSSDDGVEFALLRTLAEVDCKLLQVLGLLLIIRIHS